MSIGNVNAACACTYMSMSMHMYMDMYVHMYACAYVYMRACEILTCGGRRF